MHCAKFGRSLPSGSGGEEENVKSLQRLDRQRRQTTDKLRSEKLTFVFASGEPKKGILE